MGHKDSHTPPQFPKTRHKTREQAPLLAFRATGSADLSPVFSEFVLTVFSLFLVQMLRKNGSRMKTGASGSGLAAFGERLSLEWYAVQPPDSQTSPVQSSLASLTFTSCSSVRISSPSTCPVCATRIDRRSAFLSRYCRMRQVLFACQNRSSVRITTLNNNLKRLVVLLSQMEAFLALVHGALPNVCGC